MKSRYVYFFLCIILFSCSTDTVQDNNVPIETLGQFVSVAHPTSGTVVVNDEGTKLNITNFKTDPGPILEFYLATDLRITNDNYVNLGVLKGLSGDFEYDIPKGTNLDTHIYLIVWCTEFSIDFGHAKLK